MKHTITIIGGGPAGMAAALFAARGGAPVQLLEQNEKLGRKLYITGKGRANVTNTAEAPLAHVVRNARFLHAALAAFSAQDLRALLAQYGCPTREERGGRVFPESDHASDVTRALSRAMDEAGVVVRLNTRVRDVRALLSQGPVIIATGGASYPATGSTGDGYAFARALGHKVWDPRGALVPAVTREEWPRRLTGLALKNVRLSARVGKRTRFDGQGEMLFTHFGISGPLVLTMSSHVLDDAPEALDIRLDLKPGLTPEQLDRRIVRDFDESPRRQLVSVLPALLPASLAREIPALCGIDGAKACGQVTRAERIRLGETLKALPIPITGFRPIAEAIITRGGVDVREVNPGTMQSKLTLGLFFAGEVLDVDAHTGGYNLQIAFSTGALAGLSAARAVDADG